jgi:hypothetical protein
MPELGPSGSARGAVSDHRPYRDREQLQQDPYSECLEVHSITSSARASNVGGIVSPSSFAVLKLIGGLEV